MLDLQEMLVRPGGTSQSIKAWWSFSFRGVITRDSVMEPLGGGAGESMRRNQFSTNKKSDPASGAGAERCAIGDPGTVSAAQ